MCGLAGVVLSDRAPIDAAVLRAMTDAIAHRGPDAQGHHLAPGVALGHRRLSILDLSEAGAQPMYRGPCAIVFNGEVYNFAALRERLEARGETIRSTGDTEVVLASLLLDGPRAIESMQGFFALAHWDERKRSLLLARDRFGKKPLYYAPFGERGVEGIAFASELRALLQHPRVAAERALDTVALAQYLAHEYVPSPRSILRNVRKLEPGQQLEWIDGEGFTLRTYYRPPYTARARERDEREEVERFVSLADRAVRDRLVSDVPVGVFLSGGLDSSLIAALAVRAHPSIKTFSIGFDDPSFNEAPYARVVAEHLGTTHVEETVSVAALRDEVPSVLDWIDEPFSDSSLLPTTLLARIARRDVTVALGGDGGDEILAGYPTFVADAALRGMRLPSPLARVATRVSSAIPAGDGYMALGFKAQQFAQGLGERGVLRHAMFMAPMVPDAIAAIAGPALSREAIGGAFDVESTLSKEVRGAPIDEATAFYLRLYLGDGVLTKVDRATMRASLEARAPLLDTRLVEHCLALRPSLRLRGTTTKYLMRKALESMIPKSIIERKKQGFGAPVGAWLRGPLEGTLRETLSAERLRESGLFDARAVTAMIDAHVAGKRDLRKPLWTLMVFEHWRAKVMR